MTTPSPSHVKRIRRKFQQIEPKFDAIQTVYGMGYRWWSDRRQACRCA